MLYLDDPYLTEMDAEILDVLPDEEGFFRLILDRTVFYPMGGGQPTDQGLFTFEDGAQGEVNKVLLKEGKVNHYVKLDRAPAIGSRLKGKIDWDRRFKNMQAHSGGHIVDFAVFLLGYTPLRLQPKKGDHGKKPFIVYDGVLDDSVKPNLQAKVDEIIEKNLRFSWEFLPLEALQKEAIYLQPGLPANKPLRVLRLEGVGAVADGGTIVREAQEVGHVTVLSIANNGQETKITYRTS